MIFIDIETRSQVNLKKSGAWKYSEHESTKILICCYSVDGGNVETWVYEEPVPKVFYEHNTFVAHNALFEHALFANDTHNEWPEAMRNIDNWQCTRQIGKTLGLPGSLDPLAKVLELRHLKYKDAGTRLINHFSKPVTVGSLKGRFRNPKDHPELWGDFIEYCKQDVRVTIDIYNTLDKVSIPHWERTMRVIDHRINTRGIPIDTPMLQTLTTTITETLNNATAQAEQLGVNVNSPTQILKYCAEHGEVLPNTQADTITEWLQHDRIEKKVCELLQLRQTVAHASIKKFFTLEKQVAKDNRLRHSLAYFGGHTGRWAGRGFQPQNIPKNHSKEVVTVQALTSGGNVMETAKKLLPAVVSGSFVMGDFNAIECRILAYITGQEDVLQDFVSGRDVYKVLATKIFNVGYDEVTDKQRFIGKQGELSLGYGAGAPKFQGMCEKFGNPITDELAEHTKSTYRKTHNMVTSFWYAIEDRFRKALVTGEAEYRGFVVTSKRGHVTVLLPSGRKIYYHKCRVNDGQLEYFNYERKCYVKIYGGLITENICQAIARDILADRIIALEAVHLPAILHVHDEIVCEAEKERLQEFDTIMNTAPEWFPGFPLKTKPEYVTRYKR